MKTNIYGSASRGRGFLLAALMGAASGPAMAEAALPHIALEPARDGQWRVSYTLAQPASELRFARTDRQGNRARTWVAADDAVEMVLLDGVEVVRRTDRKPFKRVAFEVPALYMPLEKDYAPFSPFGDGGLLIHSARFHACPGSCDGFDDASWRMDIAPPPGSHVIHNGTVSPRAIRFEDRDHGTNLYVGAGTPVETDDVVAVVDAELPAAPREKLMRLLPELMEFYAAELGERPVKPMLFASSDQDHRGGGHGFQGGTLPGQVFVHFYGRHEALEKSGLVERMNWFFAHEAAHLYQGYEQSSDPADSWIHEGGAEAMAAIAVSRLGIDPPRLVQRRVVDAVDACAGGIRDFPLSESAERGKFDNYYQCGLLMQMAVDSAVRRQSGGACDLFCVWRDLQAAVAQGAPWSQATFVAAVSTHAGPETAGFVRRLAEHHHSDPHAYLIAGLEQAGLAEIARAAASKKRQATAKAGADAGD